MAKLRKYLHFISRRVWGILFSIVIAVAVMVQLGREAFPLLNDYRDQVSQVLGDLWSVDVNVGEISAQWSGLRPKISLKHVALQDLNKRNVFSFSNFTGELGLLDSIFKGRLFWRELQFENFETTLIQQADGSWQLYAFNSKVKNEKTASRYDINDPLDVMLIGRRVNLINAKINLNFSDGTESEFLIPEISIENDDDFLRITASAQLDKQSQSFRFILEGYGNPRDVEEFKPRGYISLKGFRFSKLYDLLARHLQTSNQVKLSEQQGLDIELWFNGFPHQRTRFHGSASLSNLDAQIGDVDISAEDITANVSGVWSLNENWIVSIRQLYSEINATEFENFNFDLVGYGKSVKGLRMDELDLEPINNFILSLGILGNSTDRKSATNILKGLNPKGKLQNILLEFTSKEEGYIQLQANALDVSVEPVFGVPGINGVDGYVNTSALGGYVDVQVSDGFGMAFPYIYEKPLSFDKAVARVIWGVDLAKRKAYVLSDRIDVEREGRTATGHLQLDLPFARKYGEQNMTLAIAMKNTNASSSKAYIPKTISPQLYRWLESSINEGRLTDVQFIYHGSISKSPQISPSLQLFANVYDGNIVFDPNWPELKSIDGTFYLDNVDLAVDINKAELLGNSVENAKVSLIKPTNESEMALSIQGGLSSKTSSALELLQSSPIGEVVGNVFDNWQFEGQVATNVELVIPLSEKQTKAYHKVRADFKNAGIRIPEANISISGIKGVLDYHTATGFSSSALTGTVFDRLINFNVESVPLDTAGFDTEINFFGLFDVLDLVEWTQFPELLFFKGQSDFSGKVVIAGEPNPDWPAEIVFSSNLKGVTGNLPTPFNKVAEDEWNLSGRVRLGSDKNTYAFGVNGFADFYLEDYSDQPDTGRLLLNAPKLNDPTVLQSGVFDVVGELEYFNLEQWMNVGEKYEAYSHALNLPAGEDPLTIHIRSLLKVLETPLLSVPNVSAVAVVEKADWDIKLNSDVVSGSIYLPEQTVPVLNLDKIRLDEETIEDLFGKNKFDADVRSTFKLADLTPFDFSVADVEVKGKSLGSWTFKLRVDKNKAVMKDLYAQSLGLQIGGVTGDEKLPNAQVVWLEGDDQSEGQTNIDLLVDVGDIGQTLAALYDESTLTSREGRFNVSFSWDGSPSDFDLEKVAGGISVRLLDGSFVRGAKSDETDLLRLLALFNFDTLARRLRLDFSDLAKEGFAYDEVKGYLQFENGKVVFDEPISVTSSSSNINMVGSVDLINETVNSEIVVTLPVAGNMAAIAGFIGGLPAAVGVYLAGKIFKKQVDKLSSIGYSVTGKWNDPKIKFKKVFDNSAKAKSTLKVDKDNTEFQKSAPEIDH